MRRVCAIVALLLVTSCSPTGEAGESTSVESTTTTIMDDTSQPPTTAPVEMSVISPAFDDQAAIPVEHTCDGVDVSPEMDVAGLPAETMTLAIIVDDPDAPLGTWDHWVEFDVTATGGDFVFPRDAGSVGVAGINSWRVTGYMGPCPPPGEEHTYEFTVYALDTALALPEGVDSEAVESAMSGHVLGSAVLEGTYSR